LQKITEPADGVEGTLPSYVVTISRHTTADWLTGGRTVVKSRGSQHSRPIGCQGTPILRCCDKGVITGTMQSKWTSWCPCGFKGK